jgi:hypothetical protein
MNATGPNEFSGSRVPRPASPRETTGPFGVSDPSRELLEATHVPAKSTANRVRDGQKLLAMNSPNNGRHTEHAGHDRSGREKC